MIVRLHKRVLGMNQRHDDRGYLLGHVGASTLITCPVLSPLAEMGLLACQLAKKYQHEEKSSFFIHRRRGAKQTAGTDVEFVAMHQLTEKV